VTGNQAAAWGIAVFLLIRQNISFAPAGFLFHALCAYDAFSTAQKTGRREIEFFWMS
jgi:hypothetical protein